MSADTTGQPHNGCALRTRLCSNQPRRAAEKKQRCQDSHLWASVFYSVLQHASSSRARGVRGAGYDINCYTKPLLPKKKKTTSFTHISTANTTNMHTSINCITLYLGVSSLPANKVYAWTKRKYDSILHRGNW